MDSGFGDQSYPKLPPIRKGSVKETRTSRNNDGSSSGFSRETHGLVRLPPIIRVDNMAPSPDPPENFNIRNEEEFEHSESSRFSKTKSDEHIFGHNQNLENHRNKEFNRRSEPTKRQIIQETTNNSSEFITDGHLDHNDSRKTSYFEHDKVSYGSRRDSKPASLLSTNHGESYRKRRGSLIISETEKPLHRGRRLAKSSPDLSSTRKQYYSPVRGTKPVDRGRNDFESLHHDNEFTHTLLQRSKIPNRNLTQKQSSKNRWDFPTQPQSSPCTPVIQLINDESAPRETQRNSLGDIYTGVPKERRPSINTRQKLPPKDVPKIGLMVEGKTCPQNERLTPRVSSPRPAKDSFLRIPQAQGKRDSLYDLEQILSLLNIEKGAGKSVDVRRSSTYDLQEFLEMSRPNSDSTSTDNLTKQSAKQPSDLLNTAGIEQPTDNRKGSTYDILEFLSLNAKARGIELGSQAGSKTENPTATATAPSHFLFPDVGTSTAEQRRSSAYDLMEFLSLSRQQNEETSITNQPQRPSLKPSLLQQPPQKTSLSNSLESPTVDESLRKGSIYDLQEFLNMSDQNNSTVARDKDTGPQPSPLLSPRLPSNFKFKRESIYDLQEFLGVLQNESELKRNTAKEKEQNTENNQPDTNQVLCTDTDSLKPDEPPHKNRSLSVYDLREFLSIYSAQSQPNVGNQLRRKPSEISQSSIMINVTEDEYGNGSVDDVFLAVPVEGGAGRKRSSITSVAELNELLNIINDSTRKKSISDAPAPLTRHDSGGTRSLLDLGEFLSVLNADSSPLRRRLSSVSDRGNRCPSSLSRNDSSGGSSLYDLEEFLSVINDSGQIKGASEGNESEEISIAVPQLPPRIDRNEQIGHLSSLTDVKSKTNGNGTDGHQPSLGHCH